MMAPRIPIDRVRLAEFCRRHHIRKLALFGSVLREDFRAESDVDVLYEFKSGHAVGYFGLLRMEEELGSLFGGHRVEMVEPSYLNRWIKDEVLSAAQVQY